MLMEPSKNAAAYHFHSMWATLPWRPRAAGEKGCWSFRGGQRWFDDVLAGRQCDRNWYEGVLGELGAAGTPTPTWPLSEAPALLGTEAGILDYCRSATGAGEHDPCPWVDPSRVRCGGLDNEVSAPPIGDV